MLFSIAKISLKSQHLRSHYLSSWAQIRTSPYWKLVSSSRPLHVHYQAACRDSCYFFSVKCALFLIFSRCRDLIKESGPLVFPAPEQTNTFCHNSNRKAWGLLRWSLPRKISTTSYMPYDPRKTPMRFSPHKIASRFSANARAIQRSLTGNFHLKMVNGNWLAFSSMDGHATPGSCHCAEKWNSCQNNSVRRYFILSSTRNKTKRNKSTPKNKKNWQRFHNKIFLL